MTNTDTNNIMTQEEVNTILSDTVIQLAERKISPKRAQSISRVALALSKNIANVDLKRRIEFLEEILQKRT